MVPMSKFNNFGLNDLNLSKIYIPNQYSKLQLFHLHISFFRIEAKKINGSDVQIQ